MRFLTRSEVLARFEGKRIALVGSGPGVLENERGFVDDHDLVVRVNNYRLGTEAGNRTDVFYSFFGNSIRKTRLELKRDGVHLCICKCPNAYAIKSDWHRKRKRELGVDFRWIYQRRKTFWFCDTYIPSRGEFLEGFNLLGGHVPTTGFSAILDLISFKPAALYLTGFDFFRSGIHNVKDRWNPGRPDDPIGHVPERELTWLADNYKMHPITLDRRLASEIKSVEGLLR